MKILSLLVNVLVISALLCRGSACNPAWSEGGHNLIAVMAYRMLDRDKQQTLISILRSHPQFESEFKLPEGLEDREQINEFIIGRAGYWPDVARKYREFDRPTWHYQLGATKVIGQLQPPEDPIELPEQATPETQELHVVQAIALNRQVISREDTELTEKAKAICWLAHLVADIHQPCHAGSLYIENIWPEGDRGANSIPTQQSRNMHALWDQLLGRSYDASDIRRRAFEISENEEYRKKLATLETKSDFNDPMTWVRESRELALQSVYTDAVLEYVQQPVDQRPKALNLPDEYLEKAGAVARLQALIAARRLANVWEGCLTVDSD